MRDSAAQYGRSLLHAIPLDRGEWAAVAMAKSTTLGQHSQYGSTLLSGCPSDLDGRVCQGQEQDGCLQILLFYFLFFFSFERVYVHAHV